MLPKCPSALLRRIRQADPRLDVRLDRVRGVWAVYEWLPRSRRWSYVLAWTYGGAFSSQYRPLPDSAEPILRMLAERDWAKYGARRGAWKANAGSVNSPGERRFERARKIAKGLREYYRWGFRNGNIARTNRWHKQGGALAKQGEREREAALRESLGVAGLDLARLRL